MSSLIRSDFLIEIRKSFLDMVVGMTGVPVSLYHYPEVTENFYGDRVPTSEGKLLTSDVIPILTYMKFVPKQGLTLLRGFEVYFEDEAIPMDVYFPSSVVISEGDKVVLSVMGSDGIDNVYTFKVISFRQLDMSTEFQGSIMARIVPWREKYLDVGGVK